MKVRYMMSWCRGWRASSAWQVASGLRDGAGWRHSAGGVATVAALFLLAFVAFLVAFVAVATGGRATKPVLTVAINVAPPGFDPAKSGAGHDNMVGVLTHEPIVYANPDGSFSPGLATSWQYLKASARSLRANKDFKFTLRHNARFSDGTPVTARAVKIWLDYFPTRNGPQAALMGSIASVETVGRWTVIIHLKTPNPIVPFILSNNPWGLVASPAAVANPSLFAQRTYGAGPYMLDPSQTVAGDHYTLVPNPYYYDKSRQKWSKVVVKVIPLASSLLQAMQAGQVDIGPGDATTVDAASAAGLTVVHGKGKVMTLFLDAKGVKVKALADVRVRQALNYAINRKVIAAAFVGKYGAPTSEFESSDGFDAKYVNFYKYNPAKAKSLLAAAGYPNGFTIDEVAVAGWTGSLGTPLVQAVAKDLAAVGVTVNINCCATGPEFGNAVFIHPAPLILLGIFRSVSMWQDFLTWIKPGSNGNKLGWNDPEIVKLWIKGSRAANSAPYWKQITKLLTTQAYYLPILENDLLFYVNAKVKGVVYSEHWYGGDNPRDWSPK